MSQATKPFHNRIALIFDFDRTLAASSYNALLREVGLDADSFREQEVQPLSEAGWDDTLARFHTLIQESRSRDEPITRDHLQRIGRGLDTYPGVPEMFGRVRDAARAIVDDIEVEFYLLSCGFVDLHRSMTIAEEFEDMWGSEFHFDDDGSILFVRQMITFPEKVQYLMALAKGTGVGGPNTPARVYRDVPMEEWHIPYSQMIYVGDGGSDMPAFELMYDRGGVALGVYEADSAEGWGGRDAMEDDHRVENLAPADYSEGSELLQSLLLSVESISKRIALRRLARGE